MTALSLQLLTVGHARGAVLRGISLDVHKGEVVALLGANGAGKTTLLRTIAGLAKELEGTIHIEGCPAPNGAAKRAARGIALSFQNPDDQLFGATVAEDVAIGPRQTGLSHAEVQRLVVSSLRAAGIEALAERPIDQLSFGEKRRACLAGVLAMAPRILLLDEPTAGLDPQGEMDSARLLAALARERDMTILVATHAVDLVPSFASRVVLLGEGRMLLDAPVREAFADAALLERARLRAPFAVELWRGLRWQPDPAPLTLFDARCGLAALLAQGAA